MGMMQMLMGGGRAAGVVVPLAGGTATAPGKLTIQADGVLLLDGAADQSWYTPTTASIGTGYYLRFTVQSGLLTINPAASWTQITGNIVGTPAANSSVLVEISSDASGSPLVTSGTYTLNAS